jgi:hypothetical protein
MGKVPKGLPPRRWHYLGAGEVGEKTLHRFGSGAAAAPENRDRDRRLEGWVVDNWYLLASASRLLYERLGRSALGVRFTADGTLVVPEDGGDWFFADGTPIAVYAGLQPITPTQLDRSSTRRSAAMLREHIRAYDPTQDVVLGITLASADGQEETWVYKVRAPDRPLTLAAGLVREAGFGDERLTNLRAH